ncbi:glutamine-hydrolyzing carbamoyl-phosphate synthase small subunit [Mycoplasmatota bacterium WC44]
MENRKLVLEDGTVYKGHGFGANVECVNEIVFNTSMVGYQEILSDPSYTDQMVVMTYPLIGNYGSTDEDYESKVPTMGGFVVKEYNDKPSNFRSTRTLGEVLKDYNIPGISGVDTRELTRKIRDKGTMKVLVTDISTPDEVAIEKIENYKINKDQVERVSTNKIWYSRTPNYKFNVVAIDCGIKLNIIRKLNEKGCNVTIVPFNVTSEEIRNLKPDGLFLSNGPGNPEDVESVRDIVSELQGELPIFGICLGHQIIAMANGASTYKLKFGHRGGNHPVKRLSTGKIEITSQNHSYAVEANSIKNTNLQITHVNLLDNTVEGLSKEDDFIFSVQYHPESAPGPLDSEYLFDVFIDNMIKFGGVNNA